MTDAAILYAVLFAIMGVYCIYPLFTGCVTGRESEGWYCSKHQSWADTPGGPCEADRARGDEAARLRHEGGMP